MNPWIMLFGWPVISAFFYKRFALPVALLATLLGGYLLLPEKVAWNLPVLPVLSKKTIPVLTAIVLTLIFAQQRDGRFPVLKGWIPRDHVTQLLLLVLFCSFFASALTNTDTVVYGNRVIPGLSIYDAFSQILAVSLIIAPLFLARKVFASPEAYRVLLLGLAVSGLIYTIPALYEVRMSPQLHTMLYGFFPHSFAQHMRGDGFRPVVFLNHGLALGIYFAFTLIAVACLFRISEGEQRKKWLLALIWMSVTIVLVKSLGVLMICVMIVPLVLFCSLRLQFMAAVCIAMVVLTYPALRSAHLVPVDRVMAFAESVNPQRAQSLNVRIVNEERLLAKASERPLFGWGGWGRNRIYNEYGRDISITDGEWVIVLGVGGWARYIPLFGLMIWPILKMFLFHRRDIDPVLAALALILCAKLLDMLPNSGWITPPWLIAGAMLGRMELLAGKSAQVEQVPLEQEPARSTLGYARSFTKSKEREKPLIAKSAARKERDKTVTPKTARLGYGRDQAPKRLPRTSRYSR